MMFWRPYKFLLLLPMVHISLCFAQNEISLIRVGLPSYEQKKIEKDYLAKRQYKRFVIKVSTVSSIVAALYIAHAANSYIKTLDKRVVNLEQVVSNVPLEKIEKSLRSDIVNSIDVQNNSLSIDYLAPIKLVGKGIISTVVGAKNFMTGVGKHFVEACPNFITSVVLSTVWQKMSSHITEASKVETVSWYIENHTDIWALFHDVTLSTVPYDLHCELLSLQLIQDKAGVCKKSYVAELSQLIQDHKEDMMDDGYTQHSCNQLKKGYAKKGFELECLQSYAASNLAKRRRLLEHGFEEVSLFQSNQDAYKNIQDLINLLAVNIQKVVTVCFVQLDNRRSALPGDVILRAEKRIINIIDSCNQYLSQMEILLCMDAQQLEQMSIANKGMFACTYEYERLFREQINILHRYYLLLN